MTATDPCLVYAHGASGRLVQSPGDAVRYAACLCGLCGRTWAALVDDRRRVRWGLECPWCRQVAGVEDG